MMRSMYSAVSGLKTHQTKMDVIGNNIANVNTVAFRIVVTFSEIMYQTISSASGAKRGNRNWWYQRKTVGLGVTTGATNVSITSSGAAQTTGNAFDIRLTDANSTNFFVVNNGSENLFTRAGSFYVDGSGILCMTSTGYTVMGWQVQTIQ
ncbi:MAG: flagellar hook-basal body complex protein [Lachnospiraceae bacterium]